MIPVTLPVDSPRIPPLSAGDHLTRSEFERRYLAMPESFRAELIEGIVYVGSPVRVTVHGEPLARVLGWLTHYAASTPGTEVSTDATVRLDLDNEVQPDACLRIAPSRQGQTKTSVEGYIEGAPELVVEVAASSVSIDLHAKLRAYRRNGVREYLVWRVLDAAMDWLDFADGELEHVAPGDDGLLRSRVFPGLWLDPTALLERDMAAVFRTVESGVATAEHAAFVHRFDPERGK